MKTTSSNVKSKLVKTKPNKRTRNPYKLDAYFDMVFRLESFQKAIKDLRVKYDIPKSGFKVNQNNGDAQSGWQNTGDFLLVVQEIQDLTVRFHIPGEYFEEKVREYLFFNKYSRELFGQTDLCYVKDLLNESLEPNIDYEILKNKVKRDPKLREFLGSKFGLLGIFDNQKNELLKAFPVAICISPYASLRDIQRFVAKSYKEVSAVQKKYQDSSVKIGKIRLKNNRNLNIRDFVWEHQELSLQKLSDLVEEVFPGNIDQGSVGKIRSLEKKRRTEA